MGYTKKDDIVKLKELIDEMGEEVRWSDWRDSLGRTIWRCALDLRAHRVQEFLKQLGVSEQTKPKARPRTSRQILQQMQQKHSQPLQQQPQPEQQEEQEKQEQQEHSDAQHKEAPADANDHPESAPVDTQGKESTIHADECMESVPVVTENGSVRTGGIPESNERRSPYSTPLVQMKSTAIAKSKALRAVAQDDAVALADIIGSIPVDVWSKWENKAGKSLVTLSQERGSVAAYSHLARALGLVKELKRESFEEREAVWVFIRGNVQPKRATVLADTSEDADTIPIEYWDGDEPATTVDRCSVRKMFS